jgi:hypothetical protein
MIGNASQGLSAKAFPDLLCQGDYAVSRAYRAIIFDFSCRDSDAGWLQFEPALNRDSVLILPTPEQDFTW